MTLPAHLITAYHDWHNGAYHANKDKFETLISDGQHPLAMVISCCDSRVHITDMLGASEGDFFMHRNIANFVPAFSQTGDSHGTAAAVEYAVSALGVSHIIVVGHQMCGGVQGCYDLHAGKNEALASPESFVGRWVRLMKASYEAVVGTDSESDIHEMERANVLVSLDNLKSYPFVKAALDEGRLSLHGLWHDIRHGTLHHYDKEDETFKAL